VIGRVVWPGALSAIIGQPRRWVLRRLRTLEEREFLGRKRRSSVANEPEYRFRHVLIRDVAYSQIPRGRRGEMHRRTAEWLGTLSPDRAVDRAEMLAHHFQSAYELTRTAGGNTKPLVDPARLALRDAGDRALSLHAFPAAARFFRAALDLWPPDDPERPWLLFRLGKSLYYAEAAGADVLIAAREALLAAGDDGTAAEAEAFLAYLAQHRGHHDRFSEHLHRAAGLVDGLGPSRSKAEVLVDVATHQSVAGQHDRAIAAAAEALEIAQALDLPEHEARALSIMGISRELSGDLAGRHDLERSIAMSERIGSHLSADCCGKLADLECQLGNLEACFALQARARDHAERFGHAPFVRWLEAERVGEGYWTGAWDAALEAAGSTIEQIEAGAPNFMEGYCSAMRGRIRLARGDRTGTLDDAARALRFGRTAQVPQMLYPALAFGARAEIAVGSLDKGAALADELLTRWRSSVATYPVSSWAVDLALALDSIGQGDELVQAAGSVMLRTRWLDAVVCFAAGDFQAAAERFAQIGSQPDEALARLHAAKALLHTHRDQEARGERDRALAFYRRVDARTCVREAESLTGTAVGKTI
jgi:tetratricopeptide (TPR) repeat protein